MNSEVAHTLPHIGESNHCKGEKQNSLEPLFLRILDRESNTYNVTFRWRLQKAFYTKASVGKTGCLGIGIEDIFLVTCSSDTKHKRLKDDEPGPLNLGDLEGLKPEYLSNIVVNEWKTDKSDKDAYELLIMSPTGIERLDQSKQQFEDKLSPSDIDLSVAMATSAAAVASNMGSYDKSTEGFKQLQTVLGLGMGSSLVSDLHSLQRESCLFKVRKRK